MKVRNVWLFICIVATLALGWLVLNYRILPNDFSSYSTAMEVNSKEQSTTPNDPCWFRTREGLESASDEMKKRRQESNEMKNFGYPNDTPLDEALRIFNEEMKCSPLERDYPPLTEDEVIAAIVVGVNDSKRGTTFHDERDAFWKIATQRIMPKGAVLRAHSGGNVQGSPLSPDKTIHAKGIEIFLLLGADKNGRSDFPPPAKLEEILIIRKTFSGIEVN